MPAYRRKGDPSLPTPDELRVLECAADGMTTVETAKYLNLTHDTVKHHREALLRRLNAYNTAHAVSLGYRRGLLAISDSTTAFAWNSKREDQRKVIE